MPAHAPALRTATAVLALTALLPACDDSTSPDDTTLEGTWTATSFTALGTDFIAQGMQLGVTLDASGTYDIEVEDDQVGMCDPGPDCSREGSYTSTDTQVVLDPGTDDEVAFSYSITGTTMTWSGAVQGVAATVTLTKE